MFELLISISLNTLKQCREGLLLLLSKKGLLLLNILFKSLLCNLSLFLLHLLGLKLKQLGLLVSFREGKLLSFVLEFHEFTRVSRFLTSFSSQALM